MPQLPYLDSITKLENYQIKPELLEILPLFWVEIKK